MQKLSKFHESYITVGPRGDVTFGESARRVSIKLGEFGEFINFFGLPTARRRRYLKKHQKNRISSKRAGRPAGIYAKTNIIKKTNKILKKKP
jgi:hypothetical protein